MKPFGMHPRVAAVLAVAVLAPALMAWSLAARPAGRVLSCARVPITRQPTTSGHQPRWDMPPVPGELWDIAARSSSSAVAVGGNFGALVARWNGTAWKTLSSPALAAVSFLYGVAVFHGGAWAVGTGRGQPLVVRVTGTTVRQVPVPREPDGTALLQAVAAPSATDAWAVGSIGVIGPLIWHWNGTAWKNVRLPAAVARVVLDVPGVAATSRTNVWLVSRGRIVHWNGQRWTVVSPTIVRTRYSLSSIAATSARNVWAVGNGLNKQVIVMLHWNGRQWTCALTPTVRFALVFSVSGSSADNAWAVGQGPDGQNLALHWNGHTWKQVITPTPGTSDDLFGVSVIPRSDSAWAVGATTDVGTLMLHWNGTAWR